MVRRVPWIDINYNYVDSVDYEDVIEFVIKY